MRLGELFLQAALGRDVRGDACNADDVSSLVPDRKGAVANPGDGAVRATNTIGLIEGAFTQLQQVRLDTRSILLEDRRHEAERVVVYALTTTAPDALVSRAHVDDLADRGVDQPEHVVDGRG